MKCEACGTQNVEGARFCASCGALVAVAEDPADGLIGRMIGGRFRIVRVLGEGGMGVVYEAEQQMGSALRKVAVKTLHPHLSHDPAVAARFHRECGTVAQLEHPNTINLYDFGATDDGTLYIAMEFVRGEPLNQLVEQGPIAPERALRILRQICGSLSEAHGQGIVHRDLKPENVLLTERAGEKDVVKLLDFGIAARTESADAEKEAKLTQQGMVLGTPPYMSPEQFTGKALDVRSDIYSLGVMAYEMLTGRLPFDAQTPWQWATEHMTSQPLPFEATPASASVPESMRAAILRALSKDREDRQGSVNQFYSELAGEAPVPGVQEAARPASGTAVMDAAPDFAAARPDSGGTAQMPATAAGPVVGAAPSPSPVQIQAPPAPSRPSKGGGKGLIVGLASAGGLLLVVMAVVAARSMKPAEEVALTNPFTDEAPTVTTIAPKVSADPTSAEPEPEQPSDTAPAPRAPAPANPPRGASRSDPAPSPAAASPKPAPQQPTQPAATQQPSASETAPQQPAPPAAKSTATATGESGPSGADACRAYQSAAQSGNIQGAAQHYRSCTDARAKSRCTAAAGSQAIRVVQAAAFNGDCTRAKATAAAARSMGVAAGPLDRALGSCK